MLGSMGVSTTNVGLEQQAHKQEKAQRHPFFMVTNFWILLFFSSGSKVKLKIFKSISLAWLAQQSCEQGGEVSLVLNKW